MVTRASLIDEDLKIACVTTPCFVADCTVPEAAPREVRCSAESPESLKVHWQPPPDALVHGVIQGYRILYQPVHEQLGKSCTVLNLLRQRQISVLSSSFRFLLILFFGHIIFEKWAVFPIFKSLIMFLGD